MIAPGREPLGRSADVEVASLVVVAFLSPLERGHEFRTDSWPAHVTLVPPFDTTARLENLVEAVADACRDVARIPTQVSGHDRFGRRKDVSVATLQRTPELLGLHLRLVDALLEPLGPGAVFAGDSRHVREGYRPHVTARHGEILPIGASVVLDHVAIVDRRPNARSGMRRVIEVIEL